MNIFKREMKANLKSLIIWCVCFAFLVITGMIKYAGTNGDSQALTNVIDQIPPFLKALFGLGTYDITTLIGYFGVVLFYLVLLAAVHASFVAAHIISKEEQEKTTEFLLVKPISRSKILISKIFAVFVNIIIVNIVSLISSLIIVSMMSKGVDYSTTIVLMFVEMFAVQIIFLFVGTAIATLSHKPKLAGSRATVVLVSAFLLSGLIDMFSELGFLRGFTPFKYFNGADIIKNIPPDPLMILLALGVSIVLCVVTFMGYRKRDLNV